MHQKEPVEGGFGSWWVPARYKSGDLGAFEYRSAYRAATRKRGNGAVGGRHGYPAVPRSAATSSSWWTTNVARAVDALREPGAPKTDEAREQWVPEQAAQLDLRDFHLGLPSYSPRLVRQALYVF